MGVEVLIPDFNGSDEPLRTVMEAGPDILNHNLETVERLQKPVRKRARYGRVARGAQACQGDGPRDSPAAMGTVHTKSSLMVGLGETREELQPGVPRPARGRLRHPDHRPVPAPVGATSAAGALLPSHEFAEMKDEALALGFKHVESGPLVRSSYHARDQVPDAARSRRSSRDSALAANGLRVS